MKDPKLSLCKPATRGVWIDLLCAMHEFDRIGELRGTSEQLSRLARCSTVELVEALTELQTTDAAELLQRNGTWVIANRRMKRESVIRGKRAEAGSKGGSISGANREQKPDTDSEDECQKEIIQYCISLGLPASDGEACFAKWQGNNWSNGGQPIRDWKATIRSWKLQGYMPSQKPQRNGATFGKVENLKKPGWKPSPKLEPEQHTPEFEQRLKDWIARGRPLGEDPFGDTK